MSYSIAAIHPIALASFYHLIESDEKGDQPLRALPVLHILRLSSGRFRWIIAPLKVLRKDHYLRGNFAGCSCTMGSMMFSWACRLDRICLVWLIYLHDVDINIL